MRRADRLFQLIEHLRGRRTFTARQLAERLHVSERTVYRDVGDLIASGVPIEGEAGIGYQRRRGFDLPPIMFDRDELEALVLGARLVEALGGDALAQSADFSAIDPGGVNGPCPVAPDLGVLLSRAAPSCCPTCPTRPACAAPGARR